MKIREITTDDIATCIEMGGRMHEESEFGCLEYSPEKCLIWANEILQNDTMFWIVAEDGGKIIGMMGAEAIQPYFSNDLIANDLLIYVKPEHRGSVAFLRMVEFYRAWSKDKGAKVMYLRNVWDNEKASQFYQRLGFKQVGSINRRFL